MLGCFFLKILVVDDNENISNALKQVLEIEGHECTIARNGRNGLTMIRQQKFDGVFLDLAMPEFSGVYVIDSLEESREIKEQKIIVLTASSISDEQEEDLLKKGVLMILRKPMGLDEIKEALKKL